MTGQLPKQIAGQIAAGAVLLDGMIRFTEPSQLISVLKEGYGHADESIPFAVTAFGDLLTWERDRYIYKVSLRLKKADALAAGTDFFFEDLKDPAYGAEHFEMPLFRAAEEKLGPLDASECYGAVPLEILGGSADVEHLRKVKYLEYLNLIIQSGGVIR